MHSMGAMRQSSMPFANKILMRKALAEAKETIDQDIPIWETKRYRERPTLCDGDGPSMQYRKWASQFYVAAQAAKAGE